MKSNLMPIAFDTLQAAFSRAARYEDRVDATTDYILRDEGYLRSLPQVTQEQIKPGSLFRSSEVEGWEVSHPDANYFFLDGKRVDLITVSFTNGKSEQAILIREVG